MSTILLSHVPGVAQSQIERARIKVEQEKEDIHYLHRRYLNSLEVFNDFAGRFNG